MQQSSLLTVVLSSLASTKQFVFKALTQRNNINTAFYFGLCMTSKMEITPYCEEHMPEILELWKNQYQAELSDKGAMPNTWSLRSNEIEAFLRRQSGYEHFAIARKGGEVIGYMFFQVFPFHREATAFCPIMGHAEKRDKREVLERLYQNLSEGLVAKGVLSHAITYFSHDKVVEDVVFALGFGLIVIDAFRDTKNIQSI